MNPCSTSLSMAASLLIVGLESATANAPPSPSNEQALARFETQVRPMLHQHCVGCHGTERQRGGLRLDSRQAMLQGGESGPAIVPGRPDESLLIEMLEEGRMPPKQEPRLTQDQIAELRHWIEAGAPAHDASPPSQPTATANIWRTHWAYRPIERDRALATLSPRDRQAIEERPILVRTPAIEPDDPALRDGLQGWYRGSDLKLQSGESITCWPDRSGHGRDLRPTRGAHPNGQGAPASFIATSTVNGRPAARFDEASGLGSPGDDPVPIRGDSAFTLCLVLNLRPRSGGYPHDLVVSFGEFGAASNPGKPLAGALGIQRAAGANHRLAVVGGWGHDAVFPPGSFAPLYHRGCIITVCKRPGPMSTTTEVFVNGRSSAEPPLRGGASGSTAAPDFQPRESGDFSVMLGQAAAGAGGINGDIAEVLIYNIALSPTQRQGVEAGLARLHEITSPRGWGDRPAEEALSGSASREPTGTTPLQVIDAFLNQKLAAKRLSSAPAADRRTLIRRAWFDLLGLPPAPDQIEKFVNDPSPTPLAWECLIAELLASPQYGERWGRHWLDVARYADTAGFETEEYHRNAWRYRDWVVRSFNQDTPYDRFVQEQIAADEIWPANMDAGGGYELPAEQVRRMQAQFGTGLYCIGTRVGESRLDARLLRYEDLTDWVDTTGSVFLGMTIGCARCHDHKFDPITQKDYYALQAIFQNTRQVDRSILLEVQHSNHLTDYPHMLRVAAARDAYRRYERSLGGRSPAAEEQARLRELAEQIGRRVLEVPESAPGSSPFTSRYDGLYDVPSVTVLGHEDPRFVKPVHVLKRGDLKQQRERVEPALPAALAAATGVAPTIPAGLTSRKELAQWLTRPDHPLTARVMVNRVWQWHFGRGLVPTPNDFGKMGQPPSHPELLDWLSSEFVRGGWSLKALHRLIMTSAAYQRESTFATDANLSMDPENRLLWKFPRRRLEAEAVWDAIHSVAGTLNLEMGGPPVAPPLFDEEIAALRYKHHWVVSADPAQHTRRGLYFIALRNFRFPLFDIFDSPTNAVSAPGRDVSTVAPQSLWLLNNPRVWTQARHLAARVVKHHGGSADGWVPGLWRFALGRVPSDTETVEALALLRALEAAATTDPPKDTFAASPELAALPPRRAVALIQLCVALFNHDEFLLID